MPVEVRAMLIYSAMLAALAFFYGVYKLGRATPDWLEARKAKRAAHKRKKQFRTVARANVKVQEKWAWENKFTSYHVLAIFQQNGYGERRVLCDDSGVQEFAPVREWLDGGDTEVLARELKAA